MYKKNWMFLSFFLLLLTLISAKLESKEIDLSDEEVNWIKKNSVVKFTGDPNWLPYEAFDEKGHYIGIVSEHLHLISDMTGLTFDIIPSKTWTESTEKAILF